MKNELQYEDSPYLQQHENNPVHWLPWDEKAFKKAKKENKLIFLSIGYSTCHWCHVMEKESFEDEEIAQILNDNYISIKVDREEMPHIDKYYQDVHMLLQQRPGGWPLTIIMLPEKKVIFAATYLPKNNKANMMGLKNLLQFLVNKFQDEPDECDKSAKSIQEAIERYKNHKISPTQIGHEIFEEFITNVKESFDSIYKGIGGAPKFPHASTFNTLLDIYAIFHHEQAFMLAKEALEAMMKGGIRDQIEGGFYRYSVDEAWQIPHFEKMLYTNAELLECYAKLYSFTKIDSYKQCAISTIEAMRERFLHENLYFSASDADSEGKEGLYFVFTYEQSYKALLDAGLSEEEAKEILEYFNITKKGNFENKSTNPYVNSFKKPQQYKTAIEVLKKLRKNVAYPFIDKKILTSWNALFVSSLFEAGKKVDTKYIQMATDSLDALLKIVHVNDVLYHQFIFNSTLKVKALLEDYAYLSESLIQAYETTGNEKYINLAKKFSTLAKEKFYENGVWHLDENHEANASLEDSAYKSPAATMMSVLATISLYEEDMELFEDVKKMLYLYSGHIKKYPHAYPEALRALIKIQKHEVLLKIPHEKFHTSLQKVYSFNSNFLHVKAHNQKEFQGCIMGNCFLRKDTIEEVLEEIEKQRIK